MRFDEVGMLMSDGFLFIFRGSSVNRISLLFVLSDHVHQLSSLCLIQLVDALNMTPRDDHDVIGYFMTVPNLIWKQVVCHQKMFVRHSHLLILWTKLAKVTPRCCLLFHHFSIFDIALLCRPSPIYHVPSVFLSIC